MTALCERVACSHPIEKKQKFDSPRQIDSILNSTIRVNSNARFVPPIPELSQEVGKGGNIGHHRPRREGCALLMDLRETEEAQWNEVRDQDGFLSLVGS